MSFKLATLLHDVNELQKELFKSSVDVAPFINKISHAFLPPAVYQLEEYGFPRMISRKIHQSGVFDFEREREGIHEVIEALNVVGREQLLEVSSLSEFEADVLNYFFDGIVP